MKIGDTVKVTNGSLKSYGKTGTVQSMEDKGDYTSVKVSFKGTQITTYNAKSLTVLAGTDGAQRCKGFVVGDRVVVDNIFLQSHGKRGTVVGFNTGLVEVEWDKPKLIFKYKPYNLKREFCSGDVVKVFGDEYVINSTGKQEHTCYNTNRDATLLFSIADIEQTGKRFNPSLKVGNQARVVRGKTAYFNHVGVITSVDMMAGAVTMRMPDGEEQVFDYQNVNPGITEKAHHTVKYGEAVVITKRNSPSYGKLAVVEEVNMTRVRVKFADGSREVFSDTNLSLVPDDFKQGTYAAYQIGDVVEIVGNHCKLLGRQGRVTGFSPCTNEIWVKIDRIESDCRYALCNVKKVERTQTSAESNQNNFTAVLFTGESDELGIACFVGMLNESSRAELDQGIIKKMRETGDFYYWVLYINCGSDAENHPVPVKISETLEVRKDD